MYMAIIKLKVSPFKIIGDYDLKLTMTLSQRYMLYLDKHENNTMFVSVILFTCSNHQFSRLRELMQPKIVNYLF